MVHSHRAYTWPETLNLVYEAKSKLVCILECWALPAFYWICLSNLNPFKCLIESIEVWFALSKRNSFKFKNRNSKSDIKKHSIQSRVSVSEVNCMLSFVDLVKPTLDEIVVPLLFVSHTLIERLGELSLWPQKWFWLGFTHWSVAALLSAFGSTTTQCCHAAPNSPAEK